MKKHSFLKIFLPIALLWAGAGGCAQPSAATPTPAGAPTTGATATASAAVAQASPTLETTTELSAEELSTISVFERLSPSVVYVTNLAVRRDRFSMDVTSIPQGSAAGFIWDKKGTIITK